MQEITITKMSNTYKTPLRTWGFDLNGKPFGQVWTFKSQHEVHPYHVKALDGRYTTTTNFIQAEAVMRGWM